MDEQDMPHCRLVLVCVHSREGEERPCCHAGGGAVIRERLKALVKERKLRGRIRVSGTGCLDRCAKGPNVMVFPNNLWYSGVGEGDVEAIMDEVVTSLQRDGTK
jgi:(2Fe-2S) ferredoxin